MNGQFSNETGLRERVSFWGNRYSQEGHRRSCFGLVNRPSEWRVPTEIVTRAGPDGDFSSYYYERAKVCQKARTSLRKKKRPWKTLGRSPSGLSPTGTHGTDPRTVNDAVIFETTGTRTAVILSVDTSE